MDRSAVGGRRSLKRPGAVKVAEACSDLPGMKIVWAPRGAGSLDRRNATSRRVAFRAFGTVLIRGFVKSDRQKQEWLSRDPASAAGPDMFFAAECAVMDGSSSRIRRRGRTGRICRVGRGHRTSPRLQEQTQDELVHTPKTSEGGVPTSASGRGRRPTSRRCSPDRSSGPSTLLRRFVGTVPCTPVRVGQQTPRGAGGRPLPGSRCHSTRCSSCPGLGC
jgi:hypothetical protein